MNLRSSFVITIMLISLSFFVVQHIEKNISWTTLMSDVRVAERLNEIDSWKYYGAKGYPSNDLGSMVSQTNYERAAWGQVALKFIKEMPQGYGLVLESFGHRARELWPDSKLLQSHSGWLDLTLGIGIPGILLIGLAGLLGLKNAVQVNDGFWPHISLWILSSIALLMITTEVSQKTYIDALTFLILWPSAMGLVPGSSISSNSKFRK